MITPKCRNSATNSEMSEALMKHRPNLNNETPFLLRASGLPFPDKICHNLAKFEIYEPFMRV